MKKLFNIIKRMPMIFSCVFLLLLFIVLQIYIYTTSDGKWFVDEYGTMKFIEKNGNIAKNKFVLFLNRYYFVDEKSQKVYSSWIDDNKRFIDNTGALLINRFGDYLDGLNDLYYFDKDGYILERGLHIINGKEYYINSDGSVVNNEFFDIPGDNRYVYINEKGEILKGKGKKTVYNNVFFTEENGNIIRSQWYNCDGDDIYLDYNGFIAKDYWIDDLYYIDKDGKLVKNTILPTGEELDNEGKLIIKNTIKSKLEGKKVGDEIKLGKYYFNDDKNLEDLEWVVLDINEEKALLITKYIVDCVQFSNNYYETTWEHSYLRNWLNNDFKNIVFNKNEVNYIEKKELDNEGNYIYNIDALNNTFDKIFVLSKKEHRQYFGIEDYKKGYNLKAFSVPTKYAISKGVYFEEDDTKPYNGGGSFWLRNPGMSLLYTQVCIFTGGIDLMGYQNSSKNIGVRPCIVVNCKKN